MTVAVNHTSRECVEAWVARTQASHGALLTAYAAAMYQAPHTWPVNSWCGRPILKLPGDAWMYQELIILMMSLTSVFDPSALRWLD